METAARTICPPPSACAAYSISPEPSGETGAVPAKPPLLGNAWLLTQRLRPRDRHLLLLLRSPRCKPVPIPPRWTACGATGNVRVLCLCWCCMLGGLHVSEEAKAGAIHFRIVHLWAFACCFLSLPGKLFFGGNLREESFKEPLTMSFECISSVSGCLVLTASRTQDFSFPTLQLLPGASSLALSAFVSPSLPLSAGHDSIALGHLGKLGDGGFVPAGVRGGCVGRLGASCPRTHPWRGLSLAPAQRKRSSGKECDGTEAAAALSPLFYSAGGSLERKQTTDK